jgi:long-chain acyl-CoA synthetase
LKHIIVCDVTDLLNPLMKFVVKVALTIKGPKIKRLKSTYIKFSDAIKYEKKPNKILLNREDIALLQYTGGTTGKSKAAVLTHGNLLSNIEQLNIWIGKSIEIGKESIITALPLYHIFSLTVNLFYFFSIGSKNILITNPRDLKSFIKTLRTNKFTVITAVNTLFNLLLSSSSFKKIDFKYLKFSVGGGMAVLNNTAQRWKKITKTNITQKLLQLFRLILFLMNIMELLAFLCLQLIFL